MAINKKFVLIGALLLSSFYISTHNAEVQALSPPRSWSICVSQGWESDCGYYDLYGNGSEVVNRVVGGPDLADGLWNCAVLGVNGCRAVKTGSITPEVATTTTTTTSTTTSTTVPKTTTTTSTTSTTAKTATTTTSTTVASGLGGYAVIHPDGYVCGVIVGNSYFAGNDRTMTSAYMGCPIGSKIIFQTKPSPSGNVAGWHGTDVTYSAGVFRLGNGTTIVNGIATDLDGRVWDTGSNATITPATTTTTTTTTTSTTTTTVPKKTTTTTTTAPITTTANTGTSQTKSSTTSTTPAVEDDGESDDDYADIGVSNTGGKYDLRISSSFPQTKMMLRANKKGSKSITWYLTTNTNGNYRIITTRALKGFTLSLWIDGDKWDSLVAR